VCVCVASERTRALCLLCVAAAAAAAVVRRDGGASEKGEREFGKRERERTTDRPRVLVFFFVSACRSSSAVVRNALRRVVAGHSDSSLPSPPSSSHVVRARRCVRAWPAFYSFVCSACGGSVEGRRRLLRSGGRRGGERVTLEAVEAIAREEPTTAPVQRRLRRSDVFVSSCESYLFIIFFSLSPVASTATHPVRSARFRNLCTGV